MAEEVEVDVVARAVYEKYPHYRLPPDYEGESLTKDQMIKITWEQLEEYEREIYLKENAAAIEALDHHRATLPTAQAGWRWVPEEPTEEMCLAGYNCPTPITSAHFDNIRERAWAFYQPIYRAMIAAAPQSGPTP